MRTGLLAAWTGDGLLLFGGSEGSPDTSRDAQAFPDTLDGWLLPDP